MAAAMVADWHGTPNGRHGGGDGGGRRRCFCPRRFCMTMTRWRARRACPRTAARSFTISKFHLGRRGADQDQDQPSFWS